jgi:tetratricopeptide (TPR) repeat protein
MENDLNREVNKITINNKYLKLLNSLNEVILNKNNSPAAMAQALIKKGNILQKLNNYEEALICYEQATQKEPKYALGWIGKGEIFEIVNRNDEALASYARATKEDPTYSLGCDVTP